MHIEKIEIVNFKAFEKLEFSCNESFNVIVGENNIGKSTIFEALNLWKFAYDRLIQERDKTRFYKAASNYYLPFSELNQVRLVDDEDLLHSASIANSSISVSIVDDDSRFSLKIRFEKPTIKNSYIRFYNHDDEGSFDEFEKFSNHIINKNLNLKNIIFIY